MQSPSRSSQPSTTAWLTDVKKYLKQRKVQSAELERRRRSLYSALKSDPSAPENWMNFLVNEQAIEQQHDFPFATVSLKCLYGWAIRLFPRDEFVKNTAYVHLWIGLAKQDWAKREEDARLRFSSMLKVYKVGVDCAELYCTWAILESNAGHTGKALSILQKGFVAQAQPVSLLQDTMNKVETGCGQLALPTVPMINAPLSNLCVEAAEDTAAAAGRWTGCSVSKSSSISKSSSDGTDTKTANTFSGWYTPVVEPTSSKSKRKADNDMLAPTYSSGTDVDPPKKRTPSPVNQKDMAAGNALQVHGSDIARLDSTAKTDHGKVKSDGITAQTEDDSATWEDGSPRREDGSAKGEDGSAEREDGSARREDASAGRKHDSGKMEDDVAKQEDAPAKVWDDAANREDDSYKLRNYSAKGHINSAKEQDSPAKKQDGIDRMQGDTTRPITLTQEEFDRKSCRWVGKRSIRLLLPPQEPSTGATEDKDDAIPSAQRSGALSPAAPRLMDALPSSAADNRVPPYPPAPTTLAAPMSPPAPVSLATCPSAQPPSSKPVIGPPAPQSIASATPAPTPFSAPAAPLPLAPTKHLVPPVHPVRPPPMFDGRASSGAVIHRSANAEPAGGTATAAAEPNTVQPAPMEDQTYVHVNGVKYVKCCLLGKGGSCYVYQVQEPNVPNGNMYALKRIQLDPRDPEMSKCYLEEVHLLQRLQGKRCIIKLIDSQVFRKHGVLYMILELGTTDFARMLRNREETRRERCEQNLARDRAWFQLYFKEMAWAVHTIHEERIVHSDLKPANFLMVQDQLKLIDFGIAKALTADTTHLHYGNDTRAGTPNYMSPETIGFGPEDWKVGRPSDIWSLGCILYQMVYGKTPFASEAGHRKFCSICDPNKEIAFPECGEVFAVDLMKRCLRRNPKERISMQQLLSHPFLTNSVPAPLPQPSFGTPVDQLQPQAYQTFTPITVAPAVPTPTSTPSNPVPAEVIPEVQPAVAAHAATTHAATNHAAIPVNPAVGSASAASGSTNVTAAPSKAGTNAASAAPLPRVAQHAPASKSAMLTPRLPDSQAASIMPPSQPGLPQRNKPAWRPASSAPSHSGARSNTKPSTSTALAGGKPSSSPVKLAQTSSSPGEVANISSSPVEAAKLSSPGETANVSSSPIKSAKSPPSPVKPDRTSSPSKSVKPSRPSVTTSGATGKRPGNARFKKAALPPPPPPPPTGGLLPRAKPQQKSATKQALKPKTVKTKRSGGPGMSDIAQQAAAMAAARNINRSSTEGELKPEGQQQSAPMDVNDDLHGKVAKLAAPKTTVRREHPFPSHPLPLRNITHQEFELRRVALRPVQTKAPSTTNDNPFVLPEVMQAMLKRRVLHDDD